MSWLQGFGLVDWALGWVRRLFLAFAPARAVARALMLWDLATIDAAADPTGWPLAAVARVLAQIGDKKIAQTAATFAL